MSLGIGFFGLLKANLGAVWPTLRFELGKPRVAIICKLGIALHETLKQTRHQTVCTSSAGFLLTTSKTETESEKRRCRIRILKQQPRGRQRAQIGLSTGQSSPTSDHAQTGWLAVCLAPPRACTGPENGPAGSKERRPTTRTQVLELGPRD